MALLARREAALRRHPRPRIGRWQLVVRPVAVGARGDPRETQRRHLPVERVAIGRETVGMTGAALPDHAVLPDLGIEPDHVVRAVTRLAGRSVRHAGLKRAPVRTAAPRFAIVADRAVDPGQLLGVGQFGRRQVDVAVDARVILVDGPRHHLRVHQHRLAVGARRPGIGVAHQAVVVRRRRRRRLLRQAHGGQAHQEQPRQQRPWSPHQHSVRPHLPAAQASQKGARRTHTITR